MKNTLKLRRIAAKMSDVYSPKELSQAFSIVLFSSSREMDIPLLRETLQNMDERTDEAIAPNRDSARSKLLHRIHAEQRNHIWYMPKRRFVVLAFVALLMLASIALAATGAFEAIISIWQDSFSRMRTTGELNLIDEKDVPAFLEQFEESYGSVKDDLILSTVPAEDDLNLDDALKIARTAIMEKYGTDSATLDAMGVYPEFYKTPYLDMTSEWWFYFTSITYADINEDHDCLAPGEYRVYIESPSGNVTYCYWYNDDFWTNGDAEHVWETGRYAAVLEQAQTNPCFNWLNRVQREEWIARFEAAGLDSSMLAQITDNQSRTVLVLLSTADPSSSILQSDDRLVALALAEIENQYGITRQMLIDCGYVAINGPDNNTTRNLLFTCNHELHNQIEEAKQMGMFQSDVFRYACRLGEYTVTFDSETDTMINLVRADNQPDDGVLLLSRRVWCGTDWPAFCELMDKAKELDQAEQARLYPANLASLHFQKLMRAYGGDPQWYTLPDPDDMPMAYEEAEAFAVNAVCEQTGYSAAKVNEFWPDLASRSSYYTYSDDAGSTKTAWMFNFLGNEKQKDWFVTIELPEKKVNISESSDANG